MANFAVLDNNLVVNVIVADTLEIAEEVTAKTCTELIGSAGIGWTFDGASFVKPLVEEPEVKTVQPATPMA
jgi:hypothetical protein